MRLAIAILLLSLPWTAAAEGCCHGVNEPGFRIVWDASGPADGFLVDASGRIFPASETNAWIPCTAGSVLRVRVRSLSGEHFGEWADLACEVRCLGRGYDLDGSGGPPTILDLNQFQRGYIERCT